MADARKDRRTLLSLKIRYKSATLEDFIERYSNDISRGGIFIKAKKPLAVGTLLKFEFILQDQSTLIHGVGRVVWRRDEAEADTDNPSGMGIKFIKMDPESRSIVQRIAEGRGHPGVFEQGKDGIHHGSTAASDSNDLGEADRTKLRHVSEFLASALEEGGAGEAARSEARVGAERARQVGNSIGGSRVAAARGAFSANHELPTQKRHSASNRPARNAMSAFGGVAASGRTNSSAAPAMDELDALDDFLDDETTKIKDLGASDYPDADATVISREAAAPFVAERRPTPVVPAASASALHDAVPDLFGPAEADSFGPAAGEFIDARLLDPSVATVPPRGAPVPDVPGIPAEAFRVPQAPEPVWTTRPTVKKKRSRGWMLVLLFVLFLAAAAVAAWKLGLANDLIDLAAPYLARSAEVQEKPAQVAKPVLASPAEPKPDSATAQPVEPVVAAHESGAKSPAEPSAEGASVETAAEPSQATKIGKVKFQIVSRPTGAFVTIDGKRAGRTPFEKEYEAGTQLTLHGKARGYLAGRRQITVQPDQGTVELVLAPLTYVVEVTSDPPGARASAMGAGEITTPGALEFKSMPASRQIVVTMDGYKTVKKSVTRREFVEETRRMAAAISVTLQKGAGATPVSAPQTTEPAAPPPTLVKTTEQTETEPAAAPPRIEAKLGPEPVEAAAPTEPAPAVPTETPDVDAP